MQEAKEVQKGTECRRESGCRRGGQSWEPAGMQVRARYCRELGKTRCQNWRVQKGVHLQAPAGTWEALAWRSAVDFPEPLNYECEENIGSWGKG